VTLRLIYGNIRLNTYVKLSSCYKLFFLKKIILNHKCLYLYEVFMVTYREICHLWNNNLNATICLPGDGTVNVTFVLLILQTFPNWEIDGLKEKKTVTELTELYVSIILIRFQTDNECQQKVHKIFQPEQEHAWCCLTYAWNVRPASWSYILICDDAGRDTVYTQTNHTRRRWFQYA
jgi:hypothetical protein